MTAPNLQALPRLHLALAFFLPILCLLPFLNKPFHLDDTFYLYVAEQILKNPADFYGFDISWGLLHGPAFESNKNPPGVSYMIAGVAWLLGWHEAVHHAFIALCAGILSAGVYLLGRRFCSRPLLATALTVLTPAFLVSANTVMSDLPMLALYVWALWLWIKGLEERRFGLLALAGVFMGLSTLTKYFGATSILLMLAYTIVRSVEQRRFQAWPYPFLLIPIAMIAAYQWYAAYMYGTNLLGDAADFALDLGWNQERFPTWAKPLVGLSFLGACTASLLFAAPLLWRWRAMAAGAALWLVLFGVILLLHRAGHFPGRVPVGSIALYAIQYALWITAGLFVLVLAALDLWRRRDAAAVLLALWFAGTLLFSVFVNWTINVRTMLPLVPAVAILAAHRIDAITPALSWERVAPPLVAAAALAACVLWADYRHAVSAETAAQKFLRDRAESGHRYYFKGHWGFQYYMENGGIPPFKSQGLELGEGDRVVVPVNNVIFGRFNPAVARAYKRLSLETPAGRWISTLNRKTGAGFYAHFFGAIPFVFGPVPPEEYAVYELGNYQGRSGEGQLVPLEFFELPEGVTLPPQ